MQRQKGRMTSKGEKRSRGFHFYPSSGASELPIEGQFTIINSLAVHNTAAIVSTVSVAVVTYSFRLSRDGPNHSILGTTELVWPLTASALAEPGEARNLWLSWLELEVGSAALTCLSKPFRQRHVWPYGVAGKEASSRKAGQYQAQSQSSPESSSSSTGLLSRFFCAISSSSMTFERVRTVLCSKRVSRSRKVKVSGL